MRVTRHRISSLAVCLLLTLAAWQPCQRAEAEVSIGGFIPFAGVTLTDEFKNASTDLSGGFFLTEREDSLAGNLIKGSQAPSGTGYYDIALVDTGAATHIFTEQASGRTGFGIDQNGFDGTNIQQIGGATGLILLDINDPHGFFASGLANRTSASGTQLKIDNSSFRGQSSVATLSAPSEWKLPNILGLPMAAQHAFSIRNDQPQIFQHEGRTLRTPQVDFIDLGTGGDQGIIRRTDLKVRPGASFIAGPLYIQNLDILGGNFDFHENPLSPTVVENGGLFIDVNLDRGDDAITKEFLFDTGADLTVVSELTAARLGFDPILDTPDFVLEVEGSGGVQGGVPGFYVDELKLDTVGGSFTLQNVPVAVLDVTNPNDPGNTIDGILGMHLFNDRNIVIDANASIGQGGSGPSLYISDSITTDAVWTSSAGSSEWTVASAWSGAAVPGELSATTVANVSGSKQTVTLISDETVYRLDVGGSGSAEIQVTITGGATLTSYGETKIENNGHIALGGGKLDAQFVNMEAGSRLSGQGDIFVGTGPISSSVRNLGGILDPGSDQGLLTLGTIAIEGDYSNGEFATLEIDLVTNSSGTENDLLTLDRFAFLDGELAIRHHPRGSGDTPTVGQTFTILTADEGVVGQFATVTTDPGLLWEVIYNSNSVVLQFLGEGLAGDFNADGLVDAADYTVWRAGLGTTYTEQDYAVWRSNYGTVGTSAATTANPVPEPANAVLLLTTLALTAVRKRRV